MTVNPEQGLRCAGCWLLVMGILGGIVSPLGPLWAFIVGCVLSCCAGGDAKLRKQIPCARCVSITGIVFCSISLVGAVAGGIWVMGAKSDLCNEWLHWVDYYCVSGSQSSPVDSSACTDDTHVCLQSRPAFTSFDTCASNGGGGDMCDLSLRNCVCASRRAGHLVFLCPVPRVPDPWPDRSVVAFVRARSCLYCACGVQGMAIEPVSVFLLQEKTRTRQCP